MGTGCYFHSSNAYHKATRLYKVARGTMLAALPPLPTSYDMVFRHENNLAFTYKHINMLVYRTHIDRWENNMQLWILRTYIKAV